MGGSEDQEAQATPTDEVGTEATEVQHGMGVSSEHDEDEIQEVDSREQDE